MPSRDPRVIKLTIECFDLPPPEWGGHSEIWLGIQRGKTVEQDVKLPAETVHFDAELWVAANAASASPNFLGPFSQGSPQERFLYLCWGHRHAGLWVGFRRVKVPLSGLTWENLATGRLLARIRCSDAKGAPICATVRGNVVTWSAPD